MGEGVLNENWGHPIYGERNHTGLRSDGGGGGKQKLGASDIW